MSNDGELQLERPLVWLDIEGTGTNTEDDRIVELAIARYDPEQTKPEERQRRINPGIPIPAAATEIHGISDQDVADSPRFGAIARDLLTILEGADYAGFNITGYDLPLLEAEFRRVNLAFDWTTAKIVDGYRILIQHEPRDLATMYHRATGCELAEAHAASADLQAAMVVLEDLACRHGLDRTPEALDAAGLNPEWADRTGRFIVEASGRIVFGFGKHEGKPAAAEPDYLSWMLGQDFNPDTKEIARAALEEARANSQQQELPR